MKILCVEDDDLVAGVMSGLLEHIGHEVVCCVDGWEAIGMLNAEPVDLLIADIGLPDGVDGRAVVKLVHKVTPDLPVILITGHADPANIDPSELILHKPCTLGTIEAAIRAACDRAAANRMESEHAMPYSRASGITDAIRGDRPFQRIGA